MEDFKIDKDPILKIDRIWISSDCLEEGLKYAKFKNIESVYILSAKVKDDTECIDCIDFSDLQKNKQIKALEIVAPIGKGSKIESLYELHNLTRLAYFEFDRFPLDCSKLTNLRFLYTHYSKSFELNNSLAKMTNLESLDIWHLNSDDCSFFKGLNKLKRLKIVWGKIPSLYGLQFLPELETISLYGLKNIVSIDSALANNKIIKVDIEKCKNISDKSFHVTPCNVERLYIDNIQDLYFIEYLDRIKFLGFNKCLSNNMSPLLNSPTLEEVWFLDKKQYSHKRDYINLFLSKNI